MLINMGVGVCRHEVFASLGAESTTILLLVARGCARIDSEGQVHYYRGKVVDKHPCLHEGSFFPSPLVGNK